MAHQLDRGRQKGRNWGLLVVLGLCVEFWIVAGILVDEVATSI